jgi:transmembrane sensor
VIGWYRSMRTRWTERQVYRRVVEMLDDPKHGPAVARWLAKDPGRREIYRRVSSEVGRAGDAASRLPDLADRLAEANSPARRVTLLSGTAFALAAAVASIGLVSFYRQYLPAKIDLAGITTAAAERVIQLEDGSLVTLYGHAQLVPALTVKERSVRLIFGRAVFRVARDKRRPFVVYAGGGSVTATGTEFEVSAERNVSVRMISGTVLVRLPTNHPGAPKRILAMRAGQQIAFPSHSPPMPEVDPPGAFGRRTNFDDVPLATIVAKTNELSAIKIVIADPELLQRRIFAGIDISDVNGVALKFASLFDLTIDRSIPGEIRLKKKE